MQFVCLKTVSSAAQYLRLHHHSIRPTNMSKMEHTWPGRYLRSRQSQQIINSMEQDRMCAIRYQTLRFCIRAHHMTLARPDHRIDLHQRRGYSLTSMKSAT